MVENTTKKSENSEMLQNIYSSKRATSGRIHLIIRFQGNFSKITGNTKNR